MGGRPWRIILLSLMLTGCHYESVFDVNPKDGWTFMLASLIFVGIILVARAIEWLKENFYD